VRHQVVPFQPDRDGAAVAPPHQDGLRYRTAPLSVQVAKHAVHQAGQGHVLLPNVLHHKREGDIPARLRDGCRAGTLCDFDLRQYVSKYNLRIILIRHWIPILIFTQGSKEIEVGIARIAIDGGGICEFTGSSHPKDCADLAISISSKCAKDTVCQAGNG